MTPGEAYRVLLRRYGPQGWWPVTPSGGRDPRPGGRAPRYRPGFRGRLSEREAFEVAVGAILTQNTAWTNVERALEALHGEGPLSLERLRRLPRRRLEKLIRSSGYFRQKALKLRDFAAALAAQGSSEPRRDGRLSAWLAGDLPRVREELLAVRGIGPETADSILLYAGGRDAFVVDAYTLRIGARAGWFPPGTTYAQAQAGLARALGRLARGLKARVVAFQEFHALLVQLAKLHCRTTPLCNACPLRSGCAQGRAGLRAPLPARESLEP